MDVKYLYDLNDFKCFLFQEAHPDYSDILKATTSFKNLAVSSAAFSRTSGAVSRLIPVARIYHSDVLLQRCCFTTLEGFTLDNAMAMFAQWMITANH